MVRVVRKMQAVVLAGLLGGSLFVISAPASAGGSCHNPEPSSASGAAVDAKRNCFFPTVLFVDEGDTVTWTNRDGVEHSVTGLSGGWGDESLQQGDSVAVEFSETGVYPFTCIYHPGMIGAVVVGDPSPEDAGATASNALSAPIGGPPASGSTSSNQAPPANSVTAKSDFRWAWALGGIFVLAAVLFLAFDSLRGRRLRSIA